MKAGVAYYDAGRYPEAIRTISAAYKLNPSDPTIGNALGLAYHARGRSDLGIKYLLEALTLDPNFTEARNNLVRVYIEIKDFKSAQHQLNLVKKDLTYPALDRVHFNEGLLYFDQKQYQKALIPFQSAIKHSRNSCPAHHFYGKSLFEIGRYDEASFALDRAIHFCQKSGSDEPHFLSALSYYRSGDKRKAAVRFDEITKLYPNGQFADKAKSMLEIVKQEL